MAFHYPYLLSLLLKSIEIRIVAPAMTMTTAKTEIAQSTCWSHVIPCWPPPSLTEIEKEEVTLPAAFDATMS